MQHKDHILFQFHSFSNAHRTPCNNTTSTGSRLQIPCTSFHYFTVTNLWGTSPEHVSPQARQIKSVGETGQVEVHLLKHENMCMRTHTHTHTHMRAHTHTHTVTHTHTRAHTYTHTQMWCLQMTLLIQVNSVLFKMAGIYITVQESPLYMLCTLPHIKSCSSVTYEKQFNIFWCLGNPIHAPHLLSEVSPGLPLKQFRDSGATNILWPILWYLNMRAWQAARARSQTTSSSHCTIDVWFGLDCYNRGKFWRMWCWTPIADVRISFTAC